PPVPQSAMAKLENRLMFDQARVGTPATVIALSNPSTRWRIVSGGDVERSTDGGSTWERLRTGAIVTLAAGSAPVPTICWLGGPGATGLLSPDGRSWRRVTFPEAADLASVTAADEKTATVTTADGRTFVTINGGASWELKR